MRCWLWDGTICLAGAPDRDDAAFADRLYRRVSSLARYHGNWKRWHLPLARDVIKGLREELGFRGTPVRLVFRRKRNKRHG